MIAGTRSIPVWQDCRWNFDFGYYAGTHSCYGICFGSQYTVKGAGKTSGKGRTQRITSHMSGRKADADDSERQDGSGQLFKSADSSRASRGFVSVSGGRVSREAGFSQESGKGGGSRLGSGDAWKHLPAAAG